MMDLSTRTAHEIAAQVGTPCYVYNGSRIEHNYTQLQHIFGAGSKVADGNAGSPLICYAVKANGNFEIMRLLHTLGAGFDVVSAGEMQRALHIGASPDHIVFAGVGKRDDELVAALDAHIGWINVESEQELRVLSDLAEARGQCQRVALRINPGVDPHTHTYLSTGVAHSKFGIEVDEVLHIIANHAAYSGVRIEGIHFHIGSMVSEAEPYLAALRIALDIITRARDLGAAINTLDIGGGFGIAYQPDQTPADLPAIANRILPLAHAAGLHLHLEPGRYIVGDAGALLTQVLYTKRRSARNGGTHYAVVDAAMNDLIRPALYGAKHRVTKLAGETTDGGRPTTEESAVVGRPPSVVSSSAYEIVGPICESGDFLAHEAMLPPLQRGDLLLVHDAGAYGMSMASQYNSRPRAAEVLVEGDDWRVIRPRETLRQMFEAELV